MEKKQLYPYQNLSLTDIEGEDWISIIGFEEYYMVSNFGRVKWLPRWIHFKDGRKRFFNEKILQQYIGQSRKGGSKTLFVHLIVDRCIKKNASRA